MRNFTSFAAVLFILAFLCSWQVFAQDEKPHVFTVTTWELLSPDDGSDAEFDSLGTLFRENVINKNEFIISRRVMQHLWGKSSLDFVIINEYASFSDIEKASDRNSELIKEAWPDKAERQAYFQAVFKYFGKHSDEIYQEVEAGRK